MSERRRVTLERTVTSQFGVFGILDTGSFKCATLERPAAGEHPCIPAGEYDVDWTDTHPHHNPCYEIMRVPGRTAILIHTANVFEQLLGCVAPGVKAEEMNVEWQGKRIAHPGVSGSGVALKALLDDLHREDFRLVIQEAYA